MPSAVFAHEEYPVIEDMRLMYAATAESVFLYPGALLELPSFNRLLGHAVPMDGSVGNPNGLLNFVFLNG